MQKIKLTEVKISKRFKNTTPSERKMERVRKKYRETGMQDKPIVLDENGYLIDGYVRYLILKELDMEYVNCICKKNISDKISDYKKSPTYYIYGLHKNYDKEFVWRIPFTKVNDFIGKIIPGDKVLVNTRNGARNITVTKIALLDKPPIDKSIKKVIKVI